MSDAISAVDPTTPPEPASAELLAAAGSLLRGLESLTATIRHGLESGAAAAEQAARWQRVLTLLEGDLEGARQGQQRAAAGDAEPLTALAGRLCFLARDMDGYPLEFAGADGAERIRADRQRVVLAAWQTQAAGKKAAAEKGTR